MPLARSLIQPWLYAVLAGAAILLLALRRGPVLTLLTAAAAGVAIVFMGGALQKLDAARSRVMRCYGCGIRPNLTTTSGVLVTALSQMDVLTRHA